jgi:signal transduction histidine kinase
MAVVNKNALLKNQWVSDALFMLLFGGLSVILGGIQFQMPGFEGGYSDLREIPLLIAIFHIKNPLYIIGLSIATIVGIPADAPHLATFEMHLGAILFGWIAFQIIKKLKFNSGLAGITWFIVSIFYYAGVLAPIMIITYRIEGINSDVGFVDSYISILASVRFEMISSALVSSLYLVQHDIRKSLEQSKNTLEDVVKERTRELMDANHQLQTLNEELISSNEEIKVLNENLERLVQERTQKINQQLEQLSKYAYMNSHEVRAPLARILGLLPLIKTENNHHSKTELLEKVYHCSEELDEVIKKMNRLLEREISQN